MRAITSAAILAAVSTAAALAEDVSPSSDVTTVRGTVLRGSGAGLIEGEGGSFTFDLHTLRNFKKLVRGCNLRKQGVPVPCIVKFQHVGTLVTAILSATTPAGPSEPPIKSATADPVAVNTMPTTCEGYVGRHVKPMTIEEALAPYRNLTPKDEFESTSAYRARRATEMRNFATGPIFILKRPEDQKFIHYDADSRVFKISGYAFHNTNMNYASAFRAAQFSNLYTGISINDNAAVITTADRLTGSYQASNALGARITVNNLDRITTAIFDHANGIVGPSLFPAGKGSDAWLGTIKAEPTEAKHLKTEIMLAFLVTPKEPFAVFGEHKPYNATISNPNDITEHFSILIATIHCGLVLDANNNIIAGYSAN